MHLPISIEKTVATVNRRRPSHLRLHIEDAKSAPAPIAPPHRPDEVAACLAAFASATGWAVRSTATKHRERYDESVEGGSPRTRAPLPTAAAERGSRWRVVDAAPMDGVLSAEDLKFFPTVTLEQAEQLLTTIESLVSRLEQAEETIRRQEAELATNVSVTRGPDEQLELADRLQMILEGAVKSLKASAAAIYLLDDTTTTLKMRSCYGMSVARLAEPPRQLRGSLGDLEALLGNAVLLEDTHNTPEWPSPEPWPSAIVVPIGSASMPHGTIWFWSDEVRKYATPEIEIANMAAGRVMSELEQTLLGVEAKQAKRFRRQLDAAGQAQAARLPSSQPLHDRFEIDGWTFQGDALGGGFHDWDMTPGLSLVAAVGSAVAAGPEGALVATSVQSSFRTLWPSGQNPTQILQQTADMLWGIDDAKWSGSAALFQLNPESGYGAMAAAGAVQAFIISERGFRPIGSAGPRLAAQPDPHYAMQRFILQKGEVLVAFSDTVVAGLPSLANTSSRMRRAMGRSLDQNGLLQSVKQMIDQPASEIAAQLARLLPSLPAIAPQPSDRSLIVLKHRVG